MGIIRLSLITAIGLGAGLYYFGGDEDLPADRLGRDAGIVPERSVTSAEVPEETPVSDALSEALASDQSPETASVLSVAVTNPDPAPDPIATPVAATPEPTPEPEPAAEPTRQVTFLYVTGTRVNVRGGPSTDYGVIAALGQNTAVEDLGDASGGWREIRLLDTGERGYMSERFLTADAP